jgi:hypothetical protein
MTTHPITYDKKFIVYYFINTFTGPLYTVL